MTKRANLKNARKAHKDDRLDQYSKSTKFNRIKRFGSSNSTVTRKDEREPKRLIRA